MSHVDTETYNYGYLQYFYYLATLTPTISSGLVKMGSFPSDYRDLMQFEADSRTLFELGQ